MRVPVFQRFPMTMRQVVEQLWDLRAYPTQYAFYLLALVSEDETEKTKCLELSSGAGYEDWLNYCRRPKRTMLEVLHDFHRSASRLTIQVLYEMFMPIMPRAFSIAGFKEDQLDLLVAVVEYAGRLVAPRRGLCSNWLKALGPGEGVRGWITEGTFTFPETEPCIMVGPGTGLAPFRSLIQFHVSRGTATSDRLHLFFGCRYKDKDFHCREELEQLAADGKLSLYCAFSRDQEHKIYVQDKIREHSEELWKLIHRGAHVYISGNAKNMPNNVKETLLESVLPCGLKRDFDSYIKHMQAEDRLQIETW